MPEASELTLGAAHLLLRQQVADQIRKEIIEGALRPGRRLVEQELADRMDVSRVPVREALRALESEGFVTRLPRRGVIVSPMTRRDLDDLFDVREPLEVQAVRLATQRALPEEKRELAEIVVRSADALNRKDIATVEHMNEAFHDLVIQMSHNQVLGAAFQPIQARLHWLLRQNDNPELMCREHQALYEAIAAGRVRDAVKQATSHVRTSRKLAVDRLFRVAVEAG